MRVVSLFDGMGCGREALKRAGIPVESYVAFEIDKHAIQIAKKNHPDIQHWGDVKGFPFGIFQGYDMVIGGSPCFVAGTKVICRDAYKNIEDVQAGDEVLTHENRWRKVLRTGNTVAPTYLVKAQGMKPTETTAEHPYYVREMTLPYDSIARSSYRSWTTPKWKNASDLKFDDFLAIPRITDVSSPLELSVDESYVLGRYLADGHTTKHNKSEGREHHRNWQLVLSIGSSKIEHFSSKVNIKHHVSPHTKSVYRAVFCSKRLVQMAEREIGCGAENKSISMNLIRLPTEKLEAFLQGYLDGDGSESCGVFRASSVSEVLVQTLALVVCKLYGTVASYEFFAHPKTTVIEGRTVNQRDTFTTSFRKHHPKQSNAVIKGDHLWVRFKSVEPTGCTKKVFNLEVEEDNSYTANNVVVHNCQGFSFAGKQLAFDDPRSQLFFEFVRAINEIQPKYYLLENVKMKKEFENVITHYMGVNPVEINSARLSAQNRKRLYWCNWDVPQPEDKGILLKDIIEDRVDVSVFGAAQRGRFLIDGKRADTTVDSMVGLSKQRIEISPEEKSNCLTSVQKDSLLAILQAENPRVAGLAEVEGGIRPFKDDGRKGSLSEYGRIAFEDSKAVTVSAAHAPKILQTARGNNPGGLRALDGKVPCLSANSWEHNNHLIFIRGFEEGRRLEDGKNLSRNFSEGYRVYSAEGKTATLTAQSKGGLGGATGLYATDELTIRKLTPVECERLQTLPDGYTEGVSNSQRYRMLGNGWTVDVIAHIFKSLIDSKNK